MCLSNTMMSNTTLQNPHKSLLDMVQKLTRLGEKSLTTVRLDALEFY